MNKIMEISKYTGLFHDGEILNIIHKNDSMEIWLESCEVLPEWNTENIPLSNIQTIKGILFIKKIKSILINDILTNQLKKIYDRGDISNLRIHKNKFELFVLWYDYPSKPKRSQFDHIIVEAEYIEWENLPDLINPMDN